MAEPSKKRRVEDQYPDKSLTTSGDFHFGPPETPSERASRLRREEADAAHRRSKETTVVRAIVIATAVVLVVCIGVVLVPGSPPENSKWATTLLTSVVSLGLGYLLRRDEK